MMYTVLYSFPKGHYEGFKSYIVIFYKIGFPFRSYLICLYEAMLYFQQVQQNV